MKSTGFKLPKDNTDIKYGDILESKTTHYVAVMYHEEKKIPIVKITHEDNAIFNTDIWFTLEEFIESWGSRLKITGNINVYKPSEENVI